MLRDKTRHINMAGLKRCWPYCLLTSVNAKQRISMDTMHVCAIVVFCLLTFSTVCAGAGRNLNDEFDHVDYSQVTADAQSSVAVDKVHDDTQEDVDLKTSRKVTQSKKYVKFIKQHDHSHCRWPNSFRDLFDITNITQRSSEYSRPDRQNTTFRASRTNILPRKATDQSNITLIKKQKRNLLGTILMPKKWKKSTDLAGNGDNNDPGENKKNESMVDSVDKTDTHRQKRNVDAQQEEEEEKEGGFMTKKQLVSVLSVCFILYIQF